MGRAGARSAHAEGGRTDPASSCSIVTAIALFFSTFSTPILSAALTFGSSIAGHFSADLRNFEQVVESPVAATLARGLYWVLPNLAPFDVQGTGRARPGRRAGYRAPRRRLRAHLHRRAAGRQRLRFSLAGTSSNDRRRGHPEPRNRSSEAGIIVRTAGVGPGGWKSRQAR